MHDYFFHVAIEIFAETPTQCKQTETFAPLSVLPFFKALRPFTDSSGRRSSRDRSFDQRKEQSKPRSRPQTSAQPKQSNFDFPHSDSQDHRLDTISLEGSDMSNSVGAKVEVGSKQNIIEKGIGSAISGQHMKGRYEPLKGYEGAEGWGLVHLYRDSEETSGLYKESAYRSSDLWSDGARHTSAENPHPRPKDEDCTTLCILAVPSYMTPSDFLSWVGESTRSDVSHFRMVRTSRANRYMVLIKFKHGKRAREWQYEWNGRVFNSMEVSIRCPESFPCRTDPPPSLNLAMWSFSNQSNCFRPHHWSRMAASVHQRPAIRGCRTILSFRLQRLRSLWHPGRPPSSNFLPAPCALREWTKPRGY